MNKILGRNKNKFMSVCALGRLPICGLRFKTKGKGKI